MRLKFTRQQALGSIPSPNPKRILPTLNADALCVCVCVCLSLSLSLSFWYTRKGVVASGGSVSPFLVNYIDCTRTSVYGAMRTRGVKKSPGPRKGTKTPTKVSGDESEVEAEAFEAGVSEAEHLQATPVDVKMDGDGRVIEVPSSDAEIALDIDLKSESRDANAKASTVAGTDYTAGVASVVSAEASGHVIGASLDPFEVEIGAKNVKFDEEMSEMPKETEAVNTADDEGDEKLERNNEGEEVEGIEEDCSQIEDEVEDEYEDDDEKDGEKVNDYVDVDHSYEVENFEDNAPGKDNEMSSVHTLSVMHYSKAISECRKQKRREVFIGGLNKEATEEEIRAVFEKVGKVSEIRLIRNLKSGKNKGYAFVRYADPLEAGKAVDELSGAEVHGQPCRVLPSEENDILYLGNIGKDWRKDNVIETLKKYDVESVEDVTLIEDPQNEECHQGFGFLEFSTHSDALKAFKRLQKPDAIFGGETSAKVAWAQLLDEPDEAVMLQVKSVFLDGIPSAWDEQRVKELCGKYGEIEEVDLGHKKSSSKKKKFGFIKYATREGAMACIMAINYSEVVEGEQKVTLRARLAKPVQKRRGVTRGIRGGFPIGQDVGGQVGAGSARKDRESKDHVRKRIGKSRSQRKGQKANIVKTLASRSGDQVNEDTASLEQTLSKGETASLRPQKKSRKNKRNLSRRNSFAAAEGGAYSQNAGRAGVRNYDADRYRGNVGGYREPRGRKRSYSDLEEDLRYADIPQRGYSRHQLAHPEIVSVAVPGPQYARVPYYESSHRVPVGRVAHYAVVQGVASSPGTIVQRAPTYAVYGSSASQIYASGGYSYAEVGRGGTYISSSYGGHNYRSTGNVHYSLPAANLSPYY